MVPLSECKSQTNRQGATGDGRLLGVHLDVRRVGSCWRSDISSHRMWGMSRTDSSSHMPVPPSISPFQQMSHTPSGPPGPGGWLLTAQKPWLQGGLPRPPHSRQARPASKPPPRLVPCSSLVLPVIVHPQPPPQTLAARGSGPSRAAWITGIQPRPASPERPSGLLLNEGVDKCTVIRTNREERGTVF